MRIRTCLLTIAFLLVFGWPVIALINPSFTPVHLTKGSDTILELRIPTAKLSTKEPFAVTIVKAIKGKAPGKTISILLGESDLEDRFSGKEETGAAFLSEGGGFVEIGGAWFEAYVDDGTCVLVPDKSDKTAVWAGTAEMLLRAAEYIMKSDDPVMPVSAGTQWRSCVALGKLTGAIGDILQVPDKDGTVLLVANESGDQLIRADAKALNVLRKLPTASKRLVLAEMTGDQHWDLLSWNGTELRLLPGKANGFADKAVASCSLAGEILGLQAMPGNAGVMISTTTAPQVARFSNGALKLAPLCATWPDLSKVKPLRPLLPIDLDGDGKHEWLQSASRGYVVAKATGKGWSATLHKGLRSGYEYATSAPMDVDHDGKVDVAISGGTGLSFWRNAGKKVIAHAPSGETGYIPTAAQRDILINDFNADGLQDLVILYKRAVPHLFFNRGFGTFGFATGLDLSKGEVILREAAKGQQTGELVDLDGDGALDLLLILTDGSVHGCLRKLGEAELSAQIYLPDGAAPVEVLAESEDRKLGAWSLRPGHPVRIGTTLPGPVQLRWTDAEGQTQEQEIVIEDGPIRVRLGDDAE